MSSTRSWRPLRRSAALLALSAGPLAAQGPTGTYYLAGADATTAVGGNWRIQGATATASAPAHPAQRYGESAIAVSGDVRTLGAFTGASGRLGAQYSLGFVATGVAYGGAGAVTDRHAFFDGTTDGAFNYSVAYGGGVYRMERDWTAPVLLFTPVLTGALGITYDPSNNSLWVSEFSGTRVRNYALDGTELSTFDTGGITGIGALALDYSDGTLWFGSQPNYGTFYQYSRAGVQLQTQSYADMSSANMLGGEFDLVGVAAVPEPGTLVLLAGGLALVGGASARRRRASLS